MNDPNRIKVLYIQVPPGGGSLIALYELIKNLPDLIEPVVLCYYKNKYSEKLESLSRVIYVDAEKFELNKEYKYSESKLLSSLQLQYFLSREYFVRSKKLREALYNIIKNEEPDILHHNNEIFLNRDAIRAGFKTGIPQIVHERSLGNYGINYVNLVADKALMKKVAARIDITNAVANHFDELYPGTEKKKIVLHDFIDTKQYYPAKANEQLKMSLGIGEKDIVITSIGRILKWKGQHVLIEAVNILKSKLKDFKVLIVGTDEDGIGSSSYKKELEQQINRSNLEGKIIFTGNRDDIPELINLSDVVVHCSVKPEPQGLVVIETLMCNKSLIVSGDGGSGELAKKYGGIIMKKVDALVLAKSLESILIDKKIPSINDDALQEDFEGSQQISSILSLYKKVFNKNAE